MSLPCPTSSIKPATVTSDPSARVAARRAAGAGRSLVDRVPYRLVGKSLHHRCADAMAERWVRTEDGRARLANMFLATRDPNPGLKFMIEVVGQPRSGWEMGQLFALA